MNNRKVTKKEFTLFVTVSFAAYWFANAVLWIPWKVNQGLGITVMILLVPLLWGASSYYCLARTAQANQKIAKFIVAAVFLIVAVVSDVFFFAIWRGIPEELYHPTTFAAYALILIMPIVVDVLIRRGKTRQSKCITPKRLGIIAIFGILCFACTLYSVQFW